MKSKKVKELKKWLESKTRFIDIPRDYSDDEIEAFVEIAALEKLEKNDELNEKVKEFKSRYQGNPF